jgi:hypothetical protein
MQNYLFFNRSPGISIGELVFPTLLLRKGGIIDYVTFLPL